MQNQTQINKAKEAEYFMELARQCRDLPIVNVIGSVIQLYDRGMHWEGLCPFHADEHLGSFKVTPSKNMWYCFTDNFGGGTIAFESRYYEIGFREAVFHLARRMGVITDETYNLYAKKKISADIVQNVQREMEEKKKDTAAHVKADPDVIHAVYTAVCRVCSLSQAHKKHLLHDRGLTEQDLTDYFTFPTRRFDLAGRVFKELGGELAQRWFHKPLKDLTDKEKMRIEHSPAMEKIRSQMIFVPGFYRDTARNRVDFTSYKGIGFLVRDDNGKVTGIQIRRDVIKDGESRYVWFSSSFASSNPALEGGASPGSPGGVIFPEKKTEKAALCVTEGRFKAEAIAKKGNIAVYVSGVSTWKSVVPMIKRLKGARKHVYIMFDADMMGNTAVHAQLSDISYGMKDIGLKPVLLLWPKNKGKGFDDLVQGAGSQYASCMKQIAFPDFERLYQKVLQSVLQQYGVTRVRDLPKNKACSFNTDMQLSVEKAVGVA